MGKRKRKASVSALRLASAAGLVACWGAWVPHASAGPPAAGDILDATGVRGGLVVHLGCSDGKLTAALRANDSYLVHGLEADAGRVRQARQHVRSLGLYGKVSVEQWSGNRLPYAGNLVNLLVAEDLGGVDMGEVMRVLAPNGVAYVKADGRWIKTIRPRPKEIDEWTHYLHDASNNAVANDTVVGPPRRCQWVAGPSWARSHDHLSSTSALVSAGGRIFYIVDEGPVASVAIQPRWRLVARDAFSGVLLWKRPVGPWEGHLRSFRTGPAELARRLVAVGDRVYVTLGYGKPISALDAATGKTVRTYEQTDNTLEIVCHGGALFAVVGDRPPDNTDGAAKPVKPAVTWHWWPVHEEKPPRKHVVALRADTGSAMWRKSDADTAEMMPTTLAAAGKRVFFQSHKEILALDASSGRVLWRAPRPVNRHRPSWSAPTLVVSAGVVLCGDRAVKAPTPDADPTDRPSRWMVNARGGVAPTGQLTAFAAETGRKLWEAPCRESYNSPPDVLVADGLVWSGDLVRAKEPGITVARDLKTGQVQRQRPRDQQFFKIIMSHHRCYRNKATEKYLVLGRDGIELINLATGKGLGHPWVRGACQYGVMPCNGLIYAPPHSCACHVETKVNGFYALAPAPAEQRPAEGGDARLERGAAYGKAARTGGEGDWPTYRHDALRSGRSSSVVPADIGPAWETSLAAGRLSSPVVADGKVFVACIDTHAVCALDARDGKVLWRFTAGGRVDSPPTIHAGTAIFGCADGWIYCVRAADGEMVWRFRAAPEDRRVVSYGQVESAWPVHGSVLVQGGVVYAAAGRSGFLDGGIHLLRLEAATGKKLSETPLQTGALPDVLSSDGTSVFLRHNRFDAKGVRQRTRVPHLYSPAGFLDGSWWHRTYWLCGTTMASAWGGWPQSGMRVPAGRMLVVDGKDVYGYGRLQQYHRNGSHVGLGRMRYLLYAYAGSAKAAPSPAAAAKAKAPAARKPAQAKRRGRKAPAKPQCRWSRSVPLLARAMLLSGRTLFVAGPPDCFAYAGQGITDPYHIASAEALREQEAALAGKKGALLWAVSPADGSKIAEHRLNASPVWDGLAAAGGHLYLSTVNGKVLSMHSKMQVEENR